MAWTLTGDRAILHAPNDAEVLPAMGSPIQFSWLLSLLWKRRWVLVAVFAVVSSVTYWYYRRAPRIYTCTFHVQYDLSPLSGRLAPLAEALGLTNNEDIETQMFILRSHELAKKAVERASFLPARASDAEKYALAQRIMGSTSAHRVGDSFIFEAQVLWDTPEECLDVAKAVLDAYRDYDVSARTEKDQKTKELLGQYSVKLRDDIARTRAQMVEASRLDELDKELETRQAEVGKVAQELADQAQAWSSEKEEMSRTYKETWPGIQDLVDRLEALRKIAATTADPQLDEIEAALAKAPDAAAPQPSAAALQPFIEKQRRRLLTQASILETQTRREALARSLQEKTGSSKTQRELSKLLEQYEQLQANIETEIRGMDLTMLKVSSRFTVLKEPTLPEAPISPDSDRFVYVGLAAFLVFAFASVYILESLDPSMRTIEDIQHYTGLDVVAVIPNLPREKALTEGVGVLTFGPERHGAADAYRICRVNLLALLDQAPPGKAKILITSSEPQEGKSTTVSNLACAFAESGSKTLLLSCNLRRPTMEKVFGVRHTPGLVDILSGNAAWPETVVQAVLPSLHIIPTGTIGPDSFVLLNSPRLQALLDAVSEEYDVVLVDTPPSLLASDALLLAPRVDGIVVVYSVEETSKRSLLRTVELLSKSKGKLLGIVANHKTTVARGGYYAYYHYAPHPEGAKKA